MTKLTAAERRKFYSEKLADLRHLLKTALNGMAAGDLTQALHVATMVRVLVHETGSSKPLLKHLRQNYLDLPMLDRKLIPPPGHGAAVFYCPISAQIASDHSPIRLATDLDSDAYSLSTLGKWWANICMILPGVGPIYRKELILGLVNKEGGAHVDAEISLKYRQLIESRFVQTKINDVEMGAVNISRLVAGKCGVELLDCLNRNFATI
jgi:hypothetical protein